MEGFQEREVSWNVNMAKLNSMLHYYRRLKWDKLVLLYVFFDLNFRRLNQMMHRSHMGDNRAAEEERVAALAISVIVIAQDHYVKTNSNRQANCCCLSRNDIQIIGA